MFKNTIVTKQDLLDKETDLLNLSNIKYYNVIIDVICLNPNVIKKDKYDIFLYLFNLRDLEHSKYCKMLEKFAILGVDGEIIKELVMQKNLEREVYKIFSKNERHSNMDVFLWDRELFAIKCHDILTTEQVKNLYQLYKIRDSLQYLQYIIHCCPDKIIELD